MNSSSSSTTHAPAQILLVDDNKLGLVARRRVLEEHGYHITTASHGEEALEIFRGGKFNLLITDYKMPKMDGLELIAQVRALRRPVPIILISGFADALGLNESNSGADIVLAKNAHEITNLVRAVGKLLKCATPKKPPASHRVQVRMRRQSL